MSELNEEVTKRELWHVQYHITALFGITCSLIAYGNGRPIGAIQFMAIAILTAIFSEALIRDGLCRQLTEKATGCNIDD